MKPRDVNILTLLFIPCSKQNLVGFVGKLLRGKKYSGKVVSYREKYPENVTLFHIFVDAMPRVLCINSVDTRTSSENTVVSRVETFTERRFTYR